MSQSSGGGCGVALSLMWRHPHCPDGPAPPPHPHPKALARNVKLETIARLVGRHWNQPLMNGLMFATTTMAN
jgi:hypothetical protein